MPLKIFVGALLVLLILIALNAFALNNETKSAELTVPGAQLVTTSSGPLQVLDTGPPAEQPPGEVGTGKQAGEAGPLAARDLTAGLIDARTPIVLIHGTAGAINWWDQLIPLLESDHRVIAIDLLGYGGSDKPDSDYSMETQAKLVAEVLAQLDVTGAVLVGHSMGGKVVTSVAEQSPELVSGLVILDTGPDNSMGGVSGSAKAARTPMLGQALWRLSPDFMMRRNLAQGFAPDFEVPDEFVEDVRAMTYSAFVESGRASEDYTERQSLPDRLARVGKPLLVIFGEEDQMFEARESLSAYAAIPGVKTQLITGSGHSPQVEAPAETAESILAFTYGLASARASDVARARAREQAAQRAKAKARARAKKRTRGGAGRQSGARNKRKAKPDSGQNSGNNQSGGGQSGTNRPQNQQQSRQSAEAKTESPQDWQPTPAG